MSRWPLLLVSCLVVPGVASAQFNVKGKWTTIPNSVASARWDSLDASLNLISGGGTHLALLRGNADTSWVLHWHDEKRMTRLWLVKPERDTTWGFTVVPTDPVVSDSVDLFCSGHATLGDGTLLVVGGTQVGVTGLARANVFDATKYGLSALPPDGFGGGWFRKDTTAHGRWYASVTTQGDGKVLATSGLMFMDMVMYGGAASGTVYNDSRPLKLKAYPEWDSDVMTVRAPAREGHTLTFSRELGRMVLFGGQREDGTLFTTDSLRLLFRQETDTGLLWQWDAVLALPDTVNGRTYWRPKPRTRHAAALIGDSLYIYGGISGSTVLRDAWRLKINPLPTPAQWTRLFPDSSGGTPGPVYGMAFDLDRGHDRHNVPLPKLLIHGGLSAASFFRDSVWSLSLPRSGDGVNTIAWKREASSGGPGPREGHAATMDGLRDARNKHLLSRNWLVFGGRNISGPQNDLWALTRNNTNPDSTTWYWRGLNPSTGVRPQARARHTMIHDSQWNLLRVFGGDSSLTETPAPRDDLWDIALKNLYASYNLLVPWMPRWMGDAATVPAARYGHAALHDSRPRFANLPERFDPTDGTRGRWSVLSGATKRISDYPFVFQLPSGKVFYGGNGPEDNTNNSKSYILSPSDAWVGEAQSGFLGGSAVFLGRGLKDSLSEMRRGE